MNNKLKASSADMENRRKSTAPPASSPSSEELVLSGPNQRNWRGIGIALLVIVMVCSFIITAVVLLTPRDSGPRVKGERFTLDDILGNNFTPPHYNASWISDFEFLYRRDDGALMLFDAATRNVSVFVSSEPFRKVNAQIWYLSADRRYLLLASEIHKIFRYSFLAKYWIHDRITGNCNPLTHDPSSEDHEKLQLVQWGPEENSLVYVYHNNIYYKPSAASDDVKIITNNKEDEAVFNGVPDWIYEEEILFSNTALWFSKDGRKLCFATFNDSLVSAQPFEYYGDPNKPFIYPHQDTIRYPKAGHINPTVILRVVELNYSFIGSGRRKVATSVDVKPPLTIRDQEHYVTAVAWASATELVVTWMNRRQNLSIITVCSSLSWNCSEIFREDMKQMGWVDLYEPPTFSTNGKNYLIRAAINDGDAGLFRQIVHHSLSDSSQPRTITMGKFEVTKICAFDDEEGLVYYLAAPEKRPNERQLYQIAINVLHTNLSGYCLTCHLAPDCLFVEAHFSSQAKYYILECQGPAPPKVYLVESQNNKILYTLESSDALTQNLMLKAMPRIRTFKIPVLSGYDAIVRLFLPPELRDDEITTYPLVINVYGAPGTQKVNERFDIDWGYFLSSNKSFIYGMIDGRGSGFQGEKRKFEMYRRLGTVEVDDEIDVIT
ncbi:Inactive dipeptidyl peptidase 10, variant 2 [Chamberlinius hualienensis]